MTSSFSTRAPFDAAFERRLQLVGDPLHAQLEVAVRRAEAEVRQQFLDEQLQRPAIDVVLGLDVRGDAAERVEVEREEFDGRVDADRAERLARDRAEVRLLEFGVGQRVDDLGVAALDARPDRPLVDLVAEPAPHQLDAAVDVSRVKPDALDRIALAAAPVALLEALARALRDLAELGVVVREQVDQDLRAVPDELVPRAGLGDGQVQGLARPRGSGSARRRTRCT